MNKINWSLAILDVITIAVDVIGYMTSNNILPNYASHLKSGIVCADDHCGRCIRRTGHVTQKTDERRDSIPEQNEPAKITNMDDFYYPVWWEKWSKRNYKRKVSAFRNGLKYNYNFISGCIRGICHR